MAWRNSGRQGVGVYFVCPLSAVIASFSTNPHNLEPYDYFNNPGSVGYCGATAVAALREAARITSAGMRAALDGLEVLASRISYVGDLGWELYVPIEQGARLWDLVWEAGQEHGAVHGVLELAYIAWKLVFLQRRERGAAILSGADAKASALQHAQHHIHYAGLVFDQ